MRRTGSPVSVRRRDYRTGPMPGYTSSTTRRSRDCRSAETTSGRPSRTLPVRESSAPSGTRRSELVGPVEEFGALGPTVANDFVGSEIRLSDDLLGLCLGLLADAGSRPLREQQCVPDLLLESAIALERLFELVQSRAQVV